MKHYRNQLNNLKFFTLETLFNTLKSQVEKGLFKKARPARPQARWRAERTRVRAHDQGPTCLREAATAKAGNATGLSAVALAKADALFQYPQ